MINQFLHALTNRKTISTDPMFVSDPTFTPATLTPEAQQLRTALCLDILTTDYYIKAYAAVLNIFPEIEAILADYNRSYVLSDFLPAGVQSTGGRLISNPTHSRAYLDLRPTVLPAPLTYIVDYESAGQVKLTQPDIGNVTHALVSVSTDPFESVMQI